jgi:glycosyltransferase involved in cell wall biosynthesis
MKIGINGRFLAVKQTGVQRAAYNLIRALVQVDRENEYFLFTPEEHVDNPAWDFENVTVVPSHLPEAGIFRKFLWEQITLPRLARKYKVDILHSPANTAPFFYRGKSIINIHDLCFVVNPHWYSFTFRTMYNFLVPRLARRASKVITNSNNSRNDLLQFCNLPAERVSQVYWAVDDCFLEKDLSKKSRTVEHEDYILCVSSLDPRKNIKNLLAAYENMRTNNPHIKSKLILIGGESPLFAEVLLEAKKFENDVIFKGFVDEETLLDYYAGARLCVYPSLYEGFGFPPLEAMATGVPVVTSSTSSLPEVVGKAALMVNPYDIDQIAESMAKVLNNPEISDYLITVGKEQVRKFNWYRVARNVLAVYYEVHMADRTTDPNSQFLPYRIWKNLKRLETDHMAPLVKN